MTIPTDEDLDALDWRASHYSISLDEVNLLTNSIRSLKLRINAYENVLSLLAATPTDPTGLRARALEVLSKEF